MKNSQVDKAFFSYGFEYPSSQITHVDNRSDFDASNGWLYHFNVARRSLRQQKGTDSFKK